MYRGPEIFMKYKYAAMIVNAGNGDLIRGQSFVRESEINNKIKNTLWFLSPRLIYYGLFLANNETVRVIASAWGKNFHFCKLEVLLLFAMKLQ